MRQVLVLVVVIAVATTCSLAVAARKTIPLESKHGLAAHALIQSGGANLAQFSAAHRDADGTSTMGSEPHAPLRILGRRQGMEWAESDDDRMDDGAIPSSMAAAAAAAAAGSSTNVTLPTAYAHATGATYFSRIFVGTPPQPFTVLVDTGSADLILPTRSCAETTCGLHSGAYYNAKESSTSDSIPCMHAPVRCNNNKTCSGSEACTFVDTYGDGTSLAGDIVTDTFTWEGLAAAGVAFGAMTEETSNDFPYEIDGILGLAYSTISSWGGTPPWAAVVAASDGAVDDIFSMCLATSGGAITLGGIPDQVSEASFAWTPLYDESWYRVSVIDIKARWIFRG